MLAAAGPLAYPLPSRKLAGKASRMPRASTVDEPRTIGDLLEQLGGINPLERRAGAGRRRGPSGADFAGAGGLRADAAAGHRPRGRPEEAGAGREAPEEGQAALKLGRGQCDPHRPARPLIVPAFAFRRKTTVWNAHTLPGKTRRGM